MILENNDFKLRIIEASCYMKEKTAGILNDNKTIVTLQSLRGFAFLFVFLAHTGLFKEVFLSIAIGAVSTFLVLSGFVMMYSYYGKDKINNISLKDNLCFAIKKIKKLYLLHIICTVIMLIRLLILGYFNRENAVLISIKLFLNALLIQEYFPIVGRSINSVSWYLCVTLLGYFVFPWFLKHFEKGYSKRKAIISIIVCVSIKIAIGYLYRMIPSVPNYDSTLWDNDLCQWLIYRFPIARILDIIIGFNLGFLFIHFKDYSYHTWQVTCAEIIGVVFAVFASMSFYALSPKSDAENYIFNYHPERWWTYSLAFLPSSIVLVYSFATQKGKISNLLNNKIVLYLARISPYAFLIHYVVFSYLEIVYYHIPGFSKGEFNSYYGGFINATIGLIITIILTELYMRYLTLKVQRKWNKSQ